MEILKVIILSLVEAFTEFLPVSSTGHMILIDELIKLSNNKVFTTSFQVIIQLGAILAAFIIFFEKLSPFNKNENEKKNLYSLWVKIIIAVIPAAILGLLFDDFISEKLFNSIVVASMLIFYGIVLIILENKEKKESINSFNKLSYKTAVLIGLFQCLAMVPGTSRSAASIIGAMLLGTSRIIATEFSFFLAIPTMLGATSLKLVKTGFALSSYELFLIFLGLVLSFVFSLVIIKKFLDFIKKNDFKIFAYYRIVLGIIVLIFYLVKK